MPEPKELSLDDAVSIAMHLHRDGHLDEARTLYERVLDVAPGHVDALHFLGVLCHQSGQSDRAVELILRAVGHAPDHPDLFNNLGNVCKECGRLDEAGAAYRRAVELRPDFAAAHNNLGIVLRRQNRAEPAIAAFRKAIECEPRLFVAYDNLCRLLVGQGRADEALVVARRWNDLVDSDPVARHTLAALSGEELPERCSDVYVERVFDAFAHDFDAVLTAIDYRGPQLMKAALDTCELEADSNDVLDAGCGTGLSAAVLRPLARRLIGVDLSGAMLDQARKRGGYDELIRAELTSYLRERPDAFNVIVSSDTLNYFGDLAPVLAAAHAALRKGGTFIFTLEHANDADVPVGIDLQKHGRYRHSRKYVESVIAAAGLRVRSIDRVVLRLDRGEPVAGMLVNLVKDPDDAPWKPRA